MLAVRLDVNGEIFVMLRFGESVVFLESINLRFTNRRDLTLVGIERRETFRGRTFAANRSKGIDQVFRLWLLLRLRKIDIGRVKVAEIRLAEKNSGNCSRRWIRLRRRLRSDEKRHRPFADANESDQRD